MAFDPTIRRKVRALARYETPSEEEIYESSELRDYLNSLCTSLLDGRVTPPRIQLFKGDREGVPAWTDGNSLTINWNNSITWYFPTPEQRFVATVGLFFHEIAHDLFCDFTEDARARDYIRRGIFYGEKPTNLTKDEEEAWREMETALADPCAREIFIEVYSNLSNIIADSHDENALIDEYGSFVGEGIFTCRSALHATCTLFEDMIKPKNGGIPMELPIAYNLLLQMTRFGIILCHEEDALMSSKFWPMLEKVKKHAEIACVTDDPRRAYSEMNYIVLALWPFIRAVMQNQNKNTGDPGKNRNGKKDGKGKDNSPKGDGQPGQPGQSGQSNQPQNGDNGNPGQSGTPTPEQVQKILEQLAKGAQNSGQTKAPENKKSSKSASNRRSAERKGAKKSDSAGENGEKKKDPKDQHNPAIYNALNSIQQQIAEHNAEQKLEKTQKSQLVDAVTAIDQTSSHKTVPLRLTRRLSVSESDKRTYEDVMAELKPISRRLQRQISDALRDLKEGYVTKHKLAGNILSVNDTYRPDGRWFANKKQPQDLPDMALSVLIDHSGSMGGMRINTAMRAAMLLYDFAVGIDIPVSVSGHRAIGDNVEYIVYTDFERVGDSDRYRLAQMSTDGCNRDGMAINIAAGLLEKRPEQVKLLIIVSDGRPNHANYGGKAAAEDIQQIIRNCHRKGIEVIAAAIGNDRENIQAIYQDEFLDISDLTKLPRIMTNIVKKRVLRNAL